MQVNSQDYSVRQYSQNTKSATQAGAVGSTSAEIGRASCRERV